MKLMARFVVLAIVFSMMIGSVIPDDSQRASVALVAAVVVIAFAAWYNARRRSFSR